MIFVVALVLGVLVGYLLGGRLQRISEVRLRGLALVLVAAVFKLATLLPGQPAAISEQLGPVVFPLQFVLLVAFAIINWRVIGIFFLGLGALLNLLVVSANGGYMPVPVENVRAVAGANAAAVLAGTGRVGNYVPATPDTHLWWLADILLTPGPIQKSLSLGDLFIILGLVMAIAAAMGAHLPTWAGRIQRRAEGSRPEPTQPE